MQRMSIDLSRKGHANQRICDDEPTEKMPNIANEWRRGSRIRKEVIKNRKKY